MSKKETIADRILYFRNQQNLTLAELGNKIEEITGKGYDRHVVWSYEKGQRKVPAELIPVLARIFGVTTDMLFYTEAELQELKHIDTLTTNLADYRKMAENDPAKAAVEALNRLEEAQKEIQNLKDQIKNYKNEAETYKAELEKVKPTIKKISKYIDLLGYD